MSKRTILSFFEPYKKKARVMESEEDSNLDTISDTKTENRDTEAQESPVDKDIVALDVQDHAFVSDAIIVPDDIPWYISANIGSWRQMLAKEFEKEYFKKLMRFLDTEMARYTVFPKVDEFFRALENCDYADVKVVILGQDPYHGENQAHGLAFSVLKGNTPPPSLKNIFKEAQNDVGIAKPTHGNLSSWSRQGVLLLNTCLSVRKSVANSHQKQGWEAFTDAIIREINKRNDRVVFMLWGKPAQKKCESIDHNKHCVITSSHPSPLGATKTTQPFLGSRCFSRCNEFLVSCGKEPVDWNVL